MPVAPLRSIHEGPKEDNKTKDRTRKEIEEPVNRRPSRDEVEEDTRRQRTPPPNWASING